MWLWILMGLSVITKVHGFASGAFPQACQSMLPEHTRGGTTYQPRDDDPPFEVLYQHDKEGEPITVYLQRKKSSNVKFEGFMLEARETDMVDKGPAIGKFIALEPSRTRLQACNGLPDSAASHRNNQGKDMIRVNWTAHGVEPNTSISFRVTFLQNFETFWKPVHVNVTSPPPTTPPPPSTTTSAEPSTTTPTTATSTTTPSTTTSTTKITTTPPTSSTCHPLFCAMPTTARSSTTITTTPSTPNTTLGPGPVISNLQRAGTVLMIFDSVLVEVKMELSNIVTTTLANIPFARRLSRVLKISCSLLCAAVEISALVLFVVDDSYKVALVALVCVAIAMNFIDLVIVSLPIGPSHELKEICDLAASVCSVIHEIFTIALIFLGVVEIEDCRKNGKSSSLKVMIAYTVWTSLFVIWVFLLSTQRKEILGRSKRGSSKNSKQIRQQRPKKKLSAVEVMVTAVSVIFITGTVAFAAALIAGMFEHQEE